MILHLNILSINFFSLFTQPIIWDPECCLVLLGIWFTNLNTCSSSAVKFLYLCYKIGFIKHSWYFLISKHRAKWLPCMNSFHLYGNHMALVIKLSPSTTKIMKVQEIHTTSQAHRWDGQSHVSLPKPGLKMLAPLPYLDKNVNIIKQNNICKLFNASANLWETIAQLQNSKVLPGLVTFLWPSILYTRIHSSFYMTFVLLLLQLHLDKHIVMFWVAMQSHLLRTGV